jgi:hypothetical protein
MAPRSRLIRVLALLSSVVLIPSAQAGGGFPAWGVEPSPNVGGILNAISVGSHDDIWAVGYRGGEVTPQTLTMQFDGSAWTIVPSPSLPQGSRLEDVITLSPTDAWAVGWAASPSSLDDESFTMHWDGAAWTIVSTPQPGGPFKDRLRAVDAAAPNDVWASGVFQDEQTREHSVILHWDGKTWTEFPLYSPRLSPAPSRACDTYGGLTGITVISASDIWAVGNATTCHYDGTSWTEVPSPQPRREYNELAYPLEDVSAAAANDVWAVGARVVNSPYQVYWNTLAEHWDGAQWTRFTIQIPIGQILLGVEAVAADDVWAVGADDYGVFIVHYDGTAWSRVPTPEAGHGGRLGGIDASAPLDLWAAGYTAGGNLIEHAPSGFEGAVVGDTNVAYATVSWFGPENGSTQTNPYGEYQVGGLTAGTYTFTATNPGCTPDSRSVIVQAGWTGVENFYIDCDRPGRAARRTQ